MVNKEKHRVTSMKIMIKKEIQTTQSEVITDVTCDLCGKSTKINVGSHSENHDFGKLSFHGGYGSPRDMEIIELELCLDCVEEIVTRSDKDWSNY